MINVSKYINTKTELIICINVSKSHFLPYFLIYDQIFLEAYITRYRPEI